jgi:hypothetical protein
MEKVNSPFSPLPYEEEEEEDDEGVPLDDGMNEENDQTANMSPAVISDMEQDADDGDLHAENEVGNNFAGEGATSDQLERDFAAYIEEEPPANEEQTITSNEQDVADELQASLAAGIQDDETNEDIADDSDEHVLVDSSAGTNMPDGQETTEEQINHEVVPAEGEPAVDINEDTEVEILSAPGGETATNDSPNEKEVEQQHEVYEVNAEEVADIQQPQHEEVQGHNLDAIEDVNSPQMPTSHEDDANDSIDDTKALDVSTDDATISDQAALQEIGELNAEIAAAENDMSLPSGEDTLAETNGTPENVDTEVQEPFISIEEDEAQQPIEEEYEVISTDDLPVLHKEESAESQHPEEAQVSIEIEGNAIVELPDSPTLVQAQQDTDAPPSEPANDAVDETEEDKAHQHLLDNEQLEEYVDNEQLGEYLEEQPVYTPEPERSDLQINPASHIEGVDHVSTPRLINENDGDDVQEDDNVMAALTTADEYDQHAMLDLEQPIKDVEDTIVPESVSESINETISQDDAITEDANTIESELRDSIMETEEDYTQESSMLDMK